MRVRKCKTEKDQMGIPQVMLAKFLLLGRKLLRVAIAFPLPQGLDTALKVRVLSVEVMSAVVPRRIPHVIEIIGGGGIERRFQGAGAWRRDWPWRQAGYQSCVVRRAAVDITLINPAIVPPLARQFRSINDSGVHTEGYGFP